jgi:hypothetical protein
VNRAPKRVHLKDENKIALFSTHGTSCGIRLIYKEGDARSWQANNHKRQVIVVVPMFKGLVTCKTCKKLNAL